MEEAERPLSTIETFIKYHDILYPRNQGQIWEDNFPWSQENETSSITNKEDIITTSAYMIQGQAGCCSPRYRQINVKSYRLDFYRAVKIVLTTLDLLEITV